MRSSLEIQKIRNLINSLCEKQDLRDKSIPRFLYHFSDISNIVSILECGFVGSRNLCIERGLMLNDNASKDVISITKENNKNMVRFYFRPKTPTQYHNEGIKSKYKKYKMENAHCPIPVFLVFDAVGILSLSESRFVERNLAYDPPIKSKIEELEKFDFEKIYHSGYTYDHEVIEKRHAEVLIKDKCSLENLVSVVCRSAAEKDTLINLLKLKGVNYKKYRIVTNGNHLLFNKERAYLDFVELENKYIKIGFKNFNTLTEEDTVKFIFNDVLKNTVQTIEEPANLFNKGTFRLGIKEEKIKYKFEVFVNEKQIYLGEFQSGISVPF